jgi:hypothetical protein
MIPKPVGKGTPGHSSWKQIDMRDKVKKDSSVKMKQEL